MRPKLAVITVTGCHLIPVICGTGGGTPARAGVPIRVHVIGGRDGVTDPYGEWASRREVEATGCVLVRPDRHVAWRSIRYAQDSAQRLPAMLDQALGLTGS